MGQLSTLGAAGADKLGILAIYEPFATPAPTADLEQIVATGAIPLISWGCTSVSAVASGQDDSTITAYAQSLKAFAHPVLLRWFWEMNLPNAKAMKCLAGAGPAEFVAAWQHIATIFRQVGATNVALVWCPSEQGGVANLASFFPGPTWVDWIGADGYDRKGTGAAALSEVFGSWYSTYAPYGKPMIIGETGAMPSDQAAYLQAIQTELPSQFPNIRALVYFDAAGPAGQWQLTTGLAAFNALADDPYFEAKD
jgi:beta-mannanase